MESAPLLHNQTQSRDSNWLLYHPALNLVQFITYLLSVFFPIAFIVFLSSAQSYVLIDILNEKHQLGQLTSYLGLADQFVSLIMVNIWGLMSDKLGRKKVFFIGFIFTGSSIAVFPFCSNVFPQLIAMRMLFGFGMSATLAMVTAGLADIRGQNHSGKLSALVGMASGFGALFGVALLLPMVAWLQVRYDIVTSIKCSFVIVGILSIAWGAVVLFLYPSDVPQTTQNQVPNLTDLKSQAKRWLYALKLGVKRPLVGLGYLSGLVARGDSLVLTVFITLWIRTYFEEQGLCTPVPGNDPETVKRTCREAFRLASILGGIGQTFALIAAPIFGYFLDRVSSINVLFYSCIVSCIGYFGLGNQTNPTDRMTLFYICLIGLTEIGTIVTSLKVLSDSDKVDKVQRGNVSGVYSFFGSLGIVMGVSLGGYLFDHMGATSPFYLVGSVHVILAVLSLLLIISKRL